MYIDSIRLILPTSSPDWDELVDESLFEGYKHVKRLADDYRSGTNRFDQPGEALYGAFVQDKLVAVGGLNQDPYSETRDIGRVRRVYVLPAYRRYGIGRKLMEAIVQEATRHYRIVTLRTDNPDADALYQSIGFRRDAFMRTPLII